MASVSTAPTQPRVGADRSGESVLGMGVDGPSRRRPGSMHPAPNLFEAPPTGSPRPEDPRRDHNIVRSSSSHGQSAGRGSVVSSLFDSYSLERRSLSQGNPNSPSAQHDLISSSSVATITNLTTGETASAPYSNVSSPTAGSSHHIFPINDASERDTSRKPSRKRTGPLSQASRERAAVIRKVGACEDCRRRRVACDPSHKAMTWEQAASGTGTGPEGFRELAPGSPSRGFRAVNAVHSYTNDRMELEPSPVSPESDHQPKRLRKPLPTGPRLEKTAQAALSLPPMDPPKVQDQSDPEIPTTFPTIHGRYDKVEALLLLWDDERLQTVENLVEELRSLCEERYNFTCHVYRIPTSPERASVWRSVSEALRRFNDGCDFRSALKILYYNGQARLNSSREMVLINSPQSGVPSEIRWRNIQTCLDDTTADTVILMDCPYLGSGESKAHGMLEILAAGCFDDFENGPMSRCDFTRALIEHLRRRAGQPFRDPFTVAELHAEIMSDYPRMYRDWKHDQQFLTKFPAPLYMQVTANHVLPSVQLAPLRSESTQNSPRDEIILKITGTGLNVDSIQEMLRVWSTKAQSVTMQATFHNIR